MSLINEQQRDDAQVEQPLVKPIKPNVPPVSTDAGGISAEAPLTQQVAESTSVVDVGKGFPSVATEEQPAQASVDPFSLSPQMQADAPPLPIAPTQEQLVGGIARTPSLWQNIGEDYGLDKLYSTEILQTNIPTVYTSAPTNDFISKGYGYLGEFQQRQQQASLQQAAQQQAVLQNRDRLVNVPKVDKPWYTAPDIGGMFGNFLFGSKEQQARSERGEVDIWNDVYGKQGAGAGGFLKYVLNTPLNFGIGAAAELNVTVANALEAIGVPRERAEAFARDGFLSFTPKGFPLRPSNVIGMNTERVRKQNLIVEALKGEPIGDTNDPKQDAKGAFYSPRRKPGDAWWQDPLGASIEIGVNLFNPLDSPVDDAISFGVRKLFSTFKPATKVAPEVAEVVKPKIPNAPSIPKKPTLALPPGKVEGKPVEQQLQELFAPQLKIPGPQKLLPPVKVQLGEQKLLPPARTSVVSEVDISKLPIAQPTKAPRVYNNTVEVIQKAVPPSVSLPTNVNVPFEALSGTPSELAMRIGMGKPSALPVEIPPFVVSADGALDELVVKGVDEVAEEASTYVPSERVLNLRSKLDDLKLSPEDEKLLRDAGAYDRVKANIDRSRQELEQQIDELITLEKKLVDTETLLDAAEQLASHKTIVQAPLKKLDELFEETVDFGRKQTDDVPYAKLTDTDVVNTINTGGRFNLPETAYEYIRMSAPSIEPFLREADYDSLMEFISKTGIPPEDIVRLISSANNAGINAIARSVSPAEALRGTYTEVPAPSKSTVELTSQEPTSQELARHSTEPTADDTLTQVKETAVKKARVRKAKVDAPIEITKVAKKKTVFGKLYHGTAVAGWKPQYNLLDNGSRGELGSGLYMIAADESQAAMYARSVMNENASAGARAQEVAPAVYEIDNRFNRVLDARNPLKSSDKLFKTLAQSLPDELRQAVVTSLNRDSKATYVSFMNKVEANLVKSGLEPTESTLKQVSDGISNTLRQMGYDAVYDANSKFFMALDESKLAVVNSKQLPLAETPLQAVLNKYNVDAYAAKFYPERLTTDANLRDSAYKVLSQTENSLDTKLKSIQTEIINRGIDKRDTVLPPKETFRRTATQQNPTTMTEALDEVTPKVDNPCEY
jgi:hypothetical protein